MDNFMDRLAEKLNAGEIIKANREADTEQMEMLEGKIKEYEKCLDQMCRMNQELQNTIAGMKTEGGQEQESLARLEKSVVVLQQAVTMQHKSVDGVKRSMEELSVRINDFVHKENVKVYRNVQAVVVEEAAKQNEAVKGLVPMLEEVKNAAEAQQPVPGIMKGVLGVSVTAMILAAASIVFQVLVYLQILQRLPLRQQLGSAAQGICRYREIFL